MNIVAVIIISCYVYGASAASRSSRPGSGVSYSDESCQSGYNETGGYSNYQTPTISNLTECSPEISEQVRPSSEPRQTRRASKLKTALSFEEPRQTNISKKFGRSMTFNEPNGTEIMDEEGSSSRTPISQWASKIVLSADTTPSLSRQSSMRVPRTVETPVWQGHETLMEDSPFVAPLTGDRRPTPGEGSEQGIMTKHDMSTLLTLKNQRKAFTRECKFKDLQSKSSDIRLEKMDVRRQLDDNPPPLKKMYCRLKKAYLTHQEKILEKKMKHLGKKL